MVRDAYDGNAWGCIFAHLTYCHQSILPDMWVWIYCFSSLDVSILF